MCGLQGVFDEVLGVKYCRQFIRAIVLNIEQTSMPNNSQSDSNSQSDTEMPRGRAKIFYNNSRENPTRVKPHPIAGFAIEGHREALRYRLEYFQL